MDIGSPFLSMVCRGYTIHLLAIPKWFPSKQNAVYLRKASLPQRYFRELLSQIADLCESLFKWHAWDVMNLAVRCKENTAADVTVVVLCRVYLWTCLSSYTFKATLFRKVPLHWSATKVRIRWPTKDPEEMYGLLTNVFNIAFITKIISELHWYQTSLKTEVGIHASSWSRL